MEATEQLLPAIEDASGPVRRREAPASPLPSRTGSLTGISITPLVFPQPVLLAKGLQLPPPAHHKVCVPCGQTGGPTQQEELPSPQGAFANHPWRS